MLSRSPTWWSTRRVSDTEWTRKGRSDLQRVVLEVDGRDAAYAIYRLQFDWPDQVPSTQVEVIEAIGTTPDSTAQLWRYLFDLDTVGSITAPNLSVDHPLLLLLEEPRRIGFRLGDALWVRILDIEAALAARTYGRDDRIVLEIEDRFCASNAGCYFLDGGARRAGRTLEAPDIRLTIEALGSMYLGGFAFSRLAEARRGVVELTAGAIGRADALFHSGRAPWCPEIF
jgi:predicted acetyltransferase